MNWIPKTGIRLIERTLPLNHQLTFEEKSTCLNILQGNQYNSTVWKDNLKAVYQKEKITFKI